MSLEGASVHDIADRYGLPRATIKTRLFRARERLKELLKGYFGGIGYEKRI